MEEARKTVDEWAAAKASKPYVVAAVKESMGWAIGKMITEIEYDKAVADWLKAPVEWR